MTMTWADGLALLVMAVLVLRPRFLDGPLQKYEESVHLSWTQGMLRGKLPYRDYYINYGPLYTLHFALADRLLGRTLRTHRLVFAWGHLLSVWMAYGLGTVVLPASWPRLLLALLLPFLCVDPMYLTCWGGLRFGSGLLVLALVMGAAGTGSMPAFALAGGALAVLVFFSQDEAVAVGMGCALWWGWEVLVGAGRGGTGLPPGSVMSFVLGSATVGVLAFAGLWGSGLLRAWFHDAVLGVLNMGRWRGGHSSRPRPMAGKRGLGETVRALWTQEAHFYWALLAIATLLLLVISASSSQAPPGSSMGLSWLRLLACFGLAHLWSGIRVAMGPQFKTVLPAFVILLVRFLADSACGSWVRTGLLVLTLVLVASCGYVPFLVTQRRALAQKTIPMARFSGVSMPRPMAEMLERLREGILELSGPMDEILFLPFDASSAFFADRLFYGRHSVCMTTTLFEDDREGLLAALKTRPPALVVYEPEAPDLLPGQMSTRAHLGEVIDFIQEGWEVARTIEPPPASPQLLGDIWRAWPDSWFWMVPGGARLHPVLLLTPRKETRL